MQDTAVLTGFITFCVGLWFFIWTIVVSVRLFHIKNYLKSIDASLGDMKKVVSTILDNKVKKVRYAQQKPINPFKER